MRLKKSFEIGQDLPILRKFINVKISTKKTMKLEGQPTKEEIS